MKISWKFLLLWSGRVLFVNCIIIPVLSLNEVYFSGIYVLIIGANLIIALIICISYKNIRLNICETQIIFQSGFLIKKTRIISLRFVCAVKVLNTPLSLTLGLSNAIVYCEGTRTHLPPLTRSQLKELSQLRMNHIET